MLFKSKQFKTVYKALVLAVILIIPVIYCCTYLGSLWNPYGNLNKLPVAVVNYDTGALIDGENRNLGDEICDKMTQEQTLNFVITDENSAAYGTEHGEYYATIVIPKDFTANVANASSGTETVSTIGFYPNEKSNFLSAQIMSKAVLQIEQSVTSEIDKEIVAHLTDQLGSIPSALGTLQSGLGTLYDGSITLSDGTDALADGTATLKSGTDTFAAQFGSFQIGLDNTTNGAASLHTGALTLNSGITALLSGATQLNASASGLSAITAGASGLSAATAGLDSSLADYTRNVDSFLTSSQTTIDDASDLFAYLQSVPAYGTMMSDPQVQAYLTELDTEQNSDSTLIAGLRTSAPTLSAYSAQIASGAKTLSDNTASLGQISAAAAALQSGLSDAQTGSSSLVSGTTELSSVLSKLDTASAQLGAAALSINAAADAINNAAAQLDTGAETLSAGISAAQDGLSTQIASAQSDTATLDGLSNYAATPVTVDDEPTNAVANYGTAFAPYFISLSLWIGALIAFVGIYMDLDDKFKLLSRYSEKPLRRSVLYLLLGAVQGLILGFILMKSLGLAVNHLFLFYFSCVVISMTFIAILQFLIVYLKQAGQFLAIILLIIQLAACGGTFPTQLMPALFQHIHTVIPMTYSLALLKETISGGSMSVIWTNIGILTAVGIVFAGTTVLLIATQDQRVAAAARSLGKKSEKPKKQPKPIQKLRSGETRI